MRIGLQTWGSRGDIRPFMALASGLQSKGHDVSLIVTSVDGIDYCESAAELGIRLVDVASHKTATHENYLETGKLIANETNIVKQMRLIISHLFLPAEADMYSAAEQLCRENEIIIGHSFHYAIQTAAEKYQRPFITVTLNPSVIPSSSIPPGSLPNLGKKANDFFWKLTKSTLNDNVKPYVDRLRRRNGLANAKDLISDVWLSHELNLIAVSKEICNIQTDWNDLHQVCGFFDVANVRNEGKVSEELEQFLQHGPAPVYMTFGSMIRDDIREQTEIAQLFTDAARLAGCRAIIQMSLWEDCRLSPSENVHYVRTSPHSLVFPKCVAVVHHGGAGTIQTTMLAGIPSIVVPHISDQFFWGREMKRIGVAPDMLRRKKLTKEALAKKMELVLGSIPLRTRAREVGVSMRKEDGVANAIQLIHEKYHA